MKNHHNKSNVFNMPITWLIFHDFRMIIVVLVQKNQFN